MSEDTSVGAALDLMQRFDYSQLPIMAGSRVLGAFTRRSFANGLRRVAAVDEDSLSSSVIEWAEDLAYVRHRDDLSTVLPRLKADEAVFLGDEDHLIAIVTTADVAQFLWRTTEPFAFLQDIELAMRDLMWAACPSPEVMASCIQATINRGRGQHRVATAPADLTFGQLIQVVVNEANYAKFFSLSFGRNSRLVQGQLEPVRVVRNKVFHFSGDIHREEYELLVATRRWLQRKLDAKIGAAG